MDSFEEYYQKQIDEGYIKENGYPLKCQFCNHSGLSFSGGTEEIIVICEKCGKEVAYWAYGNWFI